MGILRDREAANSVSGGQYHIIHLINLTILRRFSWPSLAYMCTQVSYSCSFYISIFFRHMHCALSYRSCQISDFSLIFEKIYNYLHEPILTWHWFDAWCLLNSCHHDVCHLSLDAICCTATQFFICLQLNGSVQ